MKKILLIVLITAAVCKTTGSYAQTYVPDSLALVDLYNSTGGPNWTNTWNLEEPVSTWYGVTVNTAGRINSLVFNDGSTESNNLIGSIPSSLGNLTMLSELNLAYNQLSGSIPPSLGNLSNLFSLSLNDNQLSGSIPSVLWNITDIAEINLSNNQLSGGIPAPLSDLTQLDLLDLSENKLSGSIPASLGALTNVNILDLSRNQLNDSIPALLFTSHIVDLYLNNNQLSGSIPSSLGALNADIIDLQDNQLSGSIPASFANIESGTELYLFDNKFTFAGMDEVIHVGERSDYAPQANIPLHYNAGQLSVSAGGTLANDTFHWYRNNVLYQVNAGDSFLTVTENGYYSVEVTNSVVTIPNTFYVDQLQDLILYSDTFDIVTFPVTILSFTATKQATQNLLQWATTQEINSSYFAVQRSSDGSNFSTLGQVNAAGNSSSTHNYTFTDNLSSVNGHPSTLFYRLKMVDKDGKFTYSQIRSINETASFAASIYPNPVLNNLNLNFSSDKAMTVQVEIINNEGKVITTQQMQVAAGASTQSINTAALSNGAYYLRLVSAEGEEELKFVKGQ